ncbi:MAG: hypothetical protein ACRETB_01855 [Steroidobacteraceae bacterium]
MTRLRPPPPGIPAANVMLALGAALAAGVALAVPTLALAQTGTAGTSALAQAPSSTLRQPQSASLARDHAAWARGALGHPGALEIVAADPATGLITVRVKDAGAFPMSATSADSTTSIGSSAGAPAGRVLLSGPGYRIAAAGPAAAGSAPTESSAAGGAELTSSLPLERRSQPIVCQGTRLLHIDSRNLEFAGDAVRAENGCEVHITNSRIVAKGFGVLASAASVHIDNSSIEGAEGSVSASDGAQVYARSSTFKGLIRRLGTATFHDMGGNAGD